MAKVKPTAIQIAVYDMAKNPLPDKLVRDLQSNVDRLIKDQPTIAQTVVTE